jgi:adenosine/AMP kinase
METKIVKIKKSEDTNVILGQSHFIKTVEDLYEAIVDSVPNIKFGIAFCESSGPCLVRSEGNDTALTRLAEENAFNIGAGHAFIIIIKDAYPINILGKIKEVSEVCSIYCASANEIEVVVAQTQQGGGIVAVIDGFSPKGIEQKTDIAARKTFLRKIGYKL